MLEKKISCTSAIPQPHQDDLLSSVMEDAEPEGSSGVGVISSSSYKSTSNSFHSQPTLSYLHCKEPPPLSKSLAISNHSPHNHHHHRMDQCDNHVSEERIPNGIEDNDCEGTAESNPGMGIPIIPGIVLSASDDGSLFGEGGFDGQLLLLDNYTAENKGAEAGQGMAQEHNIQDYSNMSIVPYSPPWFHHLPEEQIQFSMDISPAAHSLNSVPMSASEDNVVREMITVGSEGSQKGELDKEGNPLLPEPFAKTTEDSDVSFIPPAQLPSAGDGKKMDNNNGDTTSVISRSESQYDIKWVPPDGGWGWMVLMGSLIVNILIPGMVKSYGVLFIEFLEVFEASAASAAWIPALSYWLYSSMGPFASALAIRFSHRKVTILGGVLASAGLALSYFATSVTYLYFSYGIIGGLGAGLAYPIGVFMVGDYFTEKRGLANGLCTSGSALGSVVLPPLLRALLNAYGYRIAILIMAGIILNVCVGALFYDPVEKHLKKVLVEREPTEELKEPISSSPEKPKQSDFVEIQEKGSRSGGGAGGVREIAASLPIAIPTVHHNADRELRDRHGSGSIRRATFQIGHDTPQGESWSLKSMEGIGTSPLAIRLMKEETGGTGASPRTHPFRYRQVQNQSGNSLESTSDAGDGSSNIMPAASGGQSRLNLTAIPEDDDNDSCGSENEMMMMRPQPPFLNSPQASKNIDWKYFPEVQPPHHHHQLQLQKPLRLSIGGGNQLISSSHQVNHTSGLPRTLSVASNVSTSSFHYVSTIHHGSLLSALQADQTVPEFPSSATVKPDRMSCCASCLNCGLLRSSCRRTDETDEAKEKVIPPEVSKSKLEQSSSSNSSKYRKILDFSLFKDGIYIVMLLSNSTTAVGYTNFIILLPAYAIDLGFDKSQASLLLSVVAGFDFFGRIGGAALSDLRFVSRKWFYIVGLFFSGVSLSLLPLAASYRSLFIYCACFGLASGTYVGVTAVILADELGPEKLGSSYGITLFVNGVFQLAGPPICGVLYEKYRTYQPILTTLGIILIMGAMFWLAVPVIEYRRKQRLEKSLSSPPAAPTSTEESKACSKKEHDGNSVTVV